MSKRHLKLADRLGGAGQLLLAAVAAMWALEVLDLLTGHALDAWGIRPRSLRGLVGIPLSPFLHGGFAHLLANTLPLFVLGMLVSLRGTGQLVRVSLVVVLVGGAGVWLVGNSNHIGASGLIFGYFGYLLLRGLFDKSVMSLLLGLGVLLVYGGLIWGVLPSDPHVSWQAHLCGLVAGGIAARIVRPQP